MDANKEQRGLKRELRLGDLVLMQVLLIVGLNSVGSAGVLGSGHVVFWLAGIIFFYLPLAATVMVLTRAFPLEGGVYVWVKTGISPLAGYLAAWNMSFYAIVTFGTIAPGLVNSLAYVAGPRGAWMMNSPRLIAAVAGTFLFAVFAVNVRGLHLGKRVARSGSAITLVLAGLMIYLLVRRWGGDTPAATRPFQVAIPGFSIFTLLTLNVFTKISISNLSGVEGSSVFAGECRSPAHDLPRSVLFAAPLIATIYILGTGALLAYVPPSQIDLAASVQQLMQAGFGNSGLGQILTTATVCAYMLNIFAAAVAWLGMAARMPMVIGWDGLLPDWWADLHSKYRTPVKALAVVTSACLLVAFVSSWGAGGQEIYQVGLNASTACYCVMYTLLFAVILLGRRSLGFRPSLRVRLAALSGFVVSIASLPFQLVPLTAVTGQAVFGFKVGGLVCTINALGAWLYWRGARRVRGHNGIRLVA